MYLDLRRFLLKGRLWFCRFGVWLKNLHFGHASSKFSATGLHWQKLGSKIPPSQSGLNVGIGWRACKTLPKGSDWPGIGVSKHMALLLTASSQVPLPPRSEQANRNIRVWSRGTFTAGPGKENGLLPQKSQTPWRVWGKRLWRPAEGGAPSAPLAPVSTILQLAGGRLAQCYQSPAPVGLRAVCWRSSSS